jgi:hypothetical protein
MLCSYYGGDGGGEGEKMKTAQEKMQLRCESLTFRLQVKHLTPRPWVLLLLYDEQQAVINRA